MVDFLKEYKTFLIVLLGALITVIGALLDNKAKLKEKQESLNKEIERNNQYVTIIKKSDKMLERQQAVIESNTKIIELQNSLAEANQKIAELQNTTINQITGGNNVPKLSFIGSDHSLQCDVINGGKFPIRNLSVSIRITKTIYFTADPHGGFRSEDPRASTSFEKDFGDLSINTAKNIFSHAGGNEFASIRGYFDVKWLNGGYSGYLIVHYEGANPIFEKFCIYRPLIGFDLNNVVAYNGKFFAEVLP